MSTRVSKCTTRRSGRFPRPLLLPALFLLSALISSGGCAKEEPPAPRAPSQVDVAPVVVQTISPRVDLTGTVVPVNVSRVAAGISGKVQEYPFEAGAFVAEGAVLAKLNEGTKLIEIAAATAVANEKLKRWDEMKAGFRGEEVARARAARDAAQAAFDVWEGRLTRMDGARQSGAINADEYSEAVSQHKQARFTLEAADEEFKRLSTGYTPEQLAQAEAAYLAASEDVNRLENEKTKLTVLAPFDGYIAVKQAEVGEWVTEGAPIATLVKLDEVDVIANIEETSLSLARMGAVVDVRFDAFPGRTFPGVIQQIVPKSDWQSGSRSFPLRIRVKNTMTDNRPDLKEGMLARVEIKGVTHQAMLVRKDSISRSTGKPVVFVLMPDNRVRPVEIVEGMAHEGYIEVLGGDIKPGQQLVTDGVERMRAFQEVQVREPANQGQNAQAKSDGRPKADAMAAR